MKSGYVLRNTDPKDRNHPVKHEPETHVCSTPPASPRPSLQGCWGQAERERAAYGDAELVLLLRGCFSLESCSFVGMKAGVSLIFLDCFFQRWQADAWTLTFVGVLYIQTDLGICVMIPVINSVIWDAWSLVWALPALVLAEQLQKSWPFCILLEKLNKVRNFFGKYVRSWLESSESVLETFLQTFLFPFKTKALLT